ncbi:hypothetical protein GP486_001990 [Trichoglossum hirsutum]|uniref:Glycosyl transferase CAP10 domain-containing protein n=1 Tax=Trichoglossum hirsutum TaxID=265104 RepID=A0A9P8RSI0_9PEZI|nr:hypothetical protein GP486_001990 [Trichoglossum hirsutum]
MQWIQPHHYLFVTDGPQQNIVEVERDFSDLEDKIGYYLSHETEAERIADNSAKVFRDRYLTPAAEACYWRKLFRGWAEVSFEPEFYQGTRLSVGGQLELREWRGIPFESYALMQALSWSTS